MLTGPDHHRECQQRHPGDDESDDVHEPSVGRVLQRRVRIALRDAEETDAPGEWATLREVPREIRIHDTLTNSVRPLEPRDPGKVGIYACGPTVYGRIHVGNAR